MLYHTILQGLNNADLKENYTERLELIAHKLKFMDTVPVAMLNSSLEMHTQLAPYIEVAGGMMVEVPDLGAHVLFAEEGANLNELMASVPALLDGEWQAVKNNRVALINLDFYNLDEPKDRIQFIEDLAEILHPGTFVFGSEGAAWIRFGS